MNNTEPTKKTGTFLFIGLGFAVIIILLWVFRCNIFNVGCPPTEKTTDSGTVNTGPVNTGPSPSPSPSTETTTEPGGCSANYKYCAAPGQNGIKEIYASAACPKSMSLMSNLQLTMPGTGLQIEHESGMIISNCGIHDGIPPNQPGVLTSDCSYTDDNGTKVPLMNLPAVECNNGDIIIGYCATTPG